MNFPVETPDHANMLCKTHWFFRPWCHLRSLWVRTCLCQWEASLWLYIDPSGHVPFQGRNGILWDVHYRLGSMRFKVSFEYTPQRNDIHRGKVSHWRHLPNTVTLPDSYTMKEWKLVTSTKLHRPLPQITQSIPHLTHFSLRKKKSVVHHL